MKSSVLLFCLLLSSSALAQKFWTQTFQVSADKIAIGSNYLAAVTKEKIQIYDTHDFSLILETTDKNLFSYNEICWQRNHDWNTNQYIGLHYDTRFIVPHATKSWNGVKGYSSIVLTDVKSCKNLEGFIQWAHCWDSGCDTGIWIEGEFNRSNYDFYKPGEVWYYGDIDGDGIEDTMTKDSEQYVSPNDPVTHYRSIWTVYRDPEINPLIFVQSLFFGVLIDENG